MGCFPAKGRLPMQTGPCEVLADRWLLVLCDVENLTCGARDLGYKMSYGTLAVLFGEVARGCELHAFFSCEPERQSRSDYFRRRGWVPHVHAVETVRTCRGPERLTNSDNLILLSAGWLAGRREADVVVLASGDGTLVCDIARFLTASRPECPVVTLSLAGSTSARLDAAVNPYIAANLGLGRDVLRPSFGKHQRPRAAIPALSRVTGCKGST